MSEFKPITTQEAFDTAIQDRLKREKETIESQYSDYGELKTFKAKYEGEIKKAKENAETLKNDIAERDKKIKGYEMSILRTKVAHEVGLPFELAEKLSGNDEKEIRGDAEALLGIIGEKTQTPPPLADPEGDGMDEKDAAYKTMLNNLKGE